MPKLHELWLTYETPIEDDTKLMEEGSTNDEVKGTLGTTRLAMWMHDTNEELTQDKEPMKVKR